MKESARRVRGVITDFVQEFVENPYLCYTEHGLHALLYTMLYNALPAEQRYATWKGHKVCVVQKEYPTAGRLGASKRQNWDISLLKTPPVSLYPDEANAFDYLRLTAVVEFGMNATKEHLARDIECLDHKDANLDHGFAIHLYRLSKSKCKFSRRDWSPNARSILGKEKVAQMIAGTEVEVLYAMYDATGKHENGAWHLVGDSITRLI
ncbi:MAG: hypothetical protein U9R48_09830 [Chloroflexota bacterium]|nr:hypothetical protein [Chloroflexota bacterium]